MAAQSEVTSNRTIDPFFDSCIDTVISKRHKKQLFLCYGEIRTGKTTNFTLRLPYLLAHHIKPIEENGKMVRESLWFGIRESENSAVETFLEAITDSLFSPAVMASKNSPVKVYGNHPRFIKIEHGLNDGTILRFIIECHGFNTPNAENKLRSRSCLGVMIPEVQGVPKKVVETGMERAGTWRPGVCKIMYKHGDRNIIIAGASELKMVFADINIPPRPHYTYDLFFDNPSIEESGFELLKIPEVVKSIPVNNLSQAKLDKLGEYPQTIFKKQKVIWLPNENGYLLTKHWEREDDNGNKIPWTGYEYWFSKIRVSSESEINRLVLGRPDTIGGEASVYPNFDSESMVKFRDFNSGAMVYVGYDPGKSSGYAFYQIYGDSIHQFAEIYFESDDGINTRVQISDFVVPFIREQLAGSSVLVVPDPYAVISSNLGDSPVSILKEFGIKVANNAKYKISNNDTEARKSCLEYYIDSGNYTISPECKFSIKALSGGFCYTSNRQGVISNQIDKTNPYSHIAEASQYVAMYLYRQMTKEKKGKNGRSKMYKLKTV